MVEHTFKAGDRVRVVALPDYVKTADPMPMLRPPGVIALGEEGTVLERRPGDSWSVRFQRGAFLLASQYLELVEAPSVSAPGEASTGQEDAHSR
jgi:hypothetical protein